MAGMALEKPVARVSYVLDAGRKWKVRCESDDHVVLFLQAAKMFCSKMNKLAEDNLVVYKSGQVLDSDAVFQDHREYVYLKKGEMFTHDPAFDLEGMECKIPPGRPIQTSKDHPFPEEAVGIYRDLIVNKKYLKEGYLDDMEESKVELLAPIDTAPLIEILRRSIPEMPHKVVGEASAEICWDAFLRVGRKWMLANHLENM